MKHSIRPERIMGNHKSFRKISESCWLQQVRAHRRLHRNKKLWHSIPLDLLYWPIINVIQLKNLYPTDVQRISCCLLCCLSGFFLNRLSYLNLKNLCKKIVVLMLSEACCHRKMCAHLVKGLFWSSLSRAQIINTSPTSSFKPQVTIGKI